MQTTRILVTVPCSPAQADALRNSAPVGTEFRFKGAKDLEKDGRVGGRRFPDYLDEGPVTEEDAAWAQVSLGNFPIPLLPFAKNLRWVQTNSAGVEAYLRPGALPEGCLLTNATGAYGLAISEHMLGMLLEIFKKLELYRDAQREAAWATLGEVRAVYGSTVLVLGMGDIGGEFARRCKALGATVVGVRRTARARPDYCDALHTLDDLDDLLPAADVVAVTLPGTQATQNLLNRERIARMKDGAVLLNVGRGSIVDTEALCDALESGRLSGAGLDVTDPEPLPPGHRLWSLPTAVVTPHISGFYHLRETHERILGIFEENLRRYFAGEPLRNQVDGATGYRKLP